MVEIPKHILDKARSSVTPITPVASATSLRGMAQGVTAEDLSKYQGNNEDLPALIDEANKKGLMGDERLDFFRKHGFKIEEIPLPPQEPLDNSPAMLEARKALDSKSEAIVKKIESGTNIQNLSEEERNFIRRDPETLKKIFPTMTTSKQIEDLQRHIYFPAPADEVQGWTVKDPKNVFVTSDDNGIITAWRRDNGAQWSKAGWDAPKGSKVTTEEEAFDIAPISPEPQGLGINAGKKPRGRGI